MAFQTLGIKMVLQGAAKFARDIQYIANSVTQYTNMVSRMEKASLRAAQARENAAQRAMNKEINSLNQVTNAIQRYSNTYTQIAQRIQSGMANIRVFAGAEKDIQNLTRVLNTAKTNLATMRNEYSLLGREIGIETNRINTLTHNLALVKQHMGVSGLSVDEINRLVDLEANLNDAITVSTQRIDRLKIQYVDLGQKINIVNRDIANYKAALTLSQQQNKTYDESVNQVATDSQRLGEVENTLNDLMTQQMNASENVTRASQEYAQAQQETNNITSQSPTIFGALSTIVATLTGNFGKNTLGATNLETALTKMGMQAAALSVVMDTLAFAIDSVTIILGIVVGTAKLAWNIFSKLVTVAYNVAKAVGTFVVNAFKTLIGWLEKLIAIPINIVVGAINALWESLKRIGEIAIGMNLSNLIWNLGTRIKELGEQAFGAAADFQLLQIRLRGLIQREMLETKDIPFTKSLAEASVKAEELSYWISNLAVKSIFSADAVSSVFTLAMSYDMTADEAKKLTVAVMQFATGMGLGNDEMVRIVENLGQMKAMGKITGTELRDLARGAFLPVNRILKILGESLGLSADQVMKLRSNMKSLTDTEGMDVEGFTQAFLKMVGTDFPNAVENASTSWEVVTSNVKDFITTVIGWRVIKPTLDIISDRMSKFVNSFMSPEIIDAAGKVGKAFASVATVFVSISDALTKIPSSTMGVMILGLKNIASSVDALLNFDRVKGAQGVKDFFHNIQLLGWGLEQLFGINPVAAERIANDIGNIGLAFVAFKNAKPDEIGKKLKDLVKAIQTTGGDVWNNLIAPSISSLWESVKKTVGDLWTTYVLPEIKNVIKENFPDWCDQYGSIDIVKGLNSIANNISNSDFGKNFGTNLVTSISTWLSDNSGTIQGILTPIGDLLGSALNIALTTAINTGLGMATSNAGQNLAPVNVPADKIKYGATMSPLQSAIQNLKDQAKKALDEALNDLYTWAKDSVPLFDSLEKSIKIISDDIAISIDGWSAIATIFKDIWDIMSDSGLAQVGLVSLMINMSNAAGALQLAIIAINTPLIVMANTFDKISLAVTNIKKDWGDIIDTLNPAHLFERDVPNDKKFGFFSAAAKIIDDILKAFNEKIPSVIQRNSQFVGDLEQLWKDLSDHLVGHSIIPDMLDDIIKVFQQTDMRTPGYKLIKDMEDGVRQAISEFMEWWNTIKESLTLTITVSTSGSGNGTGGAGGEKGGSERKNTTNGAKAVGAKGLNLIVPPGYPDDSFLVGVSTGEGVMVIPKIDMLKNKAYNTPNAYYSVVGGMNNSPTNNRQSNYNMNVQTNASVYDIRRQFDIMRLLDSEI